MIANLDKYLIIFFIFFFLILSIYDYAYGLPVSGKVNFISLINVKNGKKVSQTDVTNGKPDVFYVCRQSDLEIKFSAVRNRTGWLYIERFYYDYFSGIENKISSSEKFIDINNIGTRTAKQVINIDNNYRLDRLYRIDAIIRHSTRYNPISIILKPIVARLSYIIYIIPCNEQLKQQ